MRVRDAPPQRAWVVDTCLILDVLEEDPRFAEASLTLLEHCQEDGGLVICPVTAVELAPAFGGKIEEQDAFLLQSNILTHLPWTHEDTQRAQRAWSRWCHQRRTDRALPRRPMADVLIGAWACRFRGLVTRNGADFKAIFPDLTVAEPVR